MMARSTRQILRGCTPSRIGSEGAPSVARPIPAVKSAATRKLSTSR